jgi:hypothetical protein
MPSRVTVGEMAEEKRYNRQKKETKLLINIIKMLAYRAETAMANLGDPIMQTVTKTGDPPQGNIHILSRYFPRL